MSTVCIYSYFHTLVAEYNLSFFVEHLLPHVTYIFVINGHYCPVEIPVLNNNVTIIKRDNIGYDFGAYRAGLDSIKDKDTFSYYVFMNSGVFGPVLPHYSRNIDYFKIFTDKITDKVKLVGTTLNITGKHAPEGFGPKIEGFFFATDTQFLKILLKDGSIFRNYDNKLFIIMYSEYGLSTCAFRSGYSIACMLRNYDKDWSDIDNWEVMPKPISRCPECVNPYEVIFHKWYWTDVPDLVCFDIIENYRRECSL
jgi:hypothetical protein